MGVLVETEVARRLRDNAYRAAPRSRKQSKHKCVLLRSYAHVCQGSQVFRGRTRQDAARH